MQSKGGIQRLIPVAFPFLMSREEGRAEDREDRMGLPKSEKKIEDCMMSSIKMESSGSRTKE